ncbi:39S ribosomal protein L11, mitochondrial-like [Mytilus californianus]|uniref:39S ribosomal protein L11, mitochondrial-like n=1 Tax=Mytilus californianus TaxID=6549 RepID=UPI0022479311|nr:39S ribosomal protein L11, mitochondrial-like [Mytilus californianus]
MAARGARKVAKGAKRGVEKIMHPPFLKTNINSCQAAPAPPLGPNLGQRGVQIAAFCKEFNEKTSHIKEGIPLPTRVFVKPDRTFDLLIKSPTATYFLLKAAGIQRGARNPGNEIAGKVTVKHIYEIAEIKSKDQGFEHVDLKNICRLVIGSAHSIGIEVVKDLDPEEYGEFLAERRLIVEQQDKELEEKKQAKLLRL